ncbi:YceI family protein [Rhizobium sp. ICMP 5592]|uniref:YceI family protein n=1 Tax=Rhizobium sp. ICMP 5592 TaxID=2292445 RepID=UPI001294B5C9|nr:YceI family protein [Rhizobium sp. ICMP 5592]MQB41019.1 hydrogenase [Rhizobium sp. ICMP 5592]
MNIHSSAPVRPALKTSKRYSAIAIVLHWATALLVISMIPMGWWMVRAINKPDTQQLAYQLFQVHKSIGFAILALTLLRIVWRLTHPVPALPADMKGWERVLARATHVAFYGLLLAIPLTGWVYISAGWAVSTDRPLMVATSWFGLFTIPDLPGLESMRSLAFGAMGAHAYMAYGGAVLIGLHVAAALKHHVIDRDGVLAQMLPFLRGKGHEDHHAPTGKALLPRGAGVAFVLLIGLVGCWLHLPGLRAEPVPVAAEAATPAAIPVSAAAPASVAADINATAWTIDKAASGITFSGSHAGKPFNGRFDEWTGDIRFDPADLPGSKAVIVVNTISAKTGDATQESSLKNGEWFNATRFPEARFETTSFKSLGGDRYEAAGSLTIKKTTVPVTLPFTYTLQGNKAEVEGSVELDRAALDLGMFSDPAAEWVSKVIEVKIAVTATRK